MGETTLQYQNHRFP